MVQHRSIEKPCAPVTYMRCNSVTDINTQRNTKSYNEETPQIIRTINIRFTTARYYFLMINDLANNCIISLPVLSYDIFLHLKVNKSTANGTKYARQIFKEPMILTFD
jgi:hypothetical protein